MQTHVWKWGQGFKIPLLWHMSQAPHSGLNIYCAGRHILLGTDSVVCQQLHWRELRIGKCGMLPKLRSEFGLPGISPKISWIPQLYLSKKYSQGICVPDQCWFLLGKCGSRQGMLTAFSRATGGTGLVWFCHFSLVITAEDCCRWSGTHPLMQLLIHSLSKYVMIT